MKKIFIALCFLSSISALAEIRQFDENSIRISDAKVLEVGAYELNDAHWVRISVEDNGKVLTLEITGETKSTGLAAADGFDHLKAVDCDNISEHFYEDSLSIDFSKKQATYFDNDVATTLPCKTLGDTYVCANKRFTVKLLMNGKALVTEGVNKPNLIKFECAL
ncbi:MAG: hypothetical protein HYW49_06485 [Deltaproteobacteria bacterium]|nr:hypothetical protein [Deltaproteobacteria bacterium]